MANTKVSGMRLDQETENLIDELKNLWGGTKTSVVKQAVRESARREGIKVVKKLIGKDIIGRTVIVKCEDAKAVRVAKRQYAKVGIALRSYDEAIRNEADRLVNRPDDVPEYKF